MKISKSEVPDGLVLDYFMVIFHISENKMYWFDSVRADLHTEIKKYKDADDDRFDLTLSELCEKKFNKREKL